jgi:4-diphosphocytidyl-2-C-methyl-D-erythritol kinase
MIGPAPAKINLALVVGPQRPDGNHELVTVYQRVDLGDRIRIEPAAGNTRISGYPEDTIVRDALLLLDAQRGWHVHIEKHIPVAAGLGGGSSDAATALRLANDQLPEPLPGERLADLAFAVGTDVPFFLHDGPQLGTGEGATLTPLDLPQDFAVLLLLPRDVHKVSTAAVYADFDARVGADGFDDRAESLRDALAAVRRPRDLAGLPPNDLASSPLAAELRAHGAFRADVSGAGPVLYGLFNRTADAQRAARAIGHLGRIWITVPAWYG